MGVYYPKQPTDESGAPITGVPTARSKAFASYGVYTQAVSSVITLTDNTRMIEITAGGGAVAMAFIARADTIGSVVATGSTANFDHVIASNTTQRFAIPEEIQGTSSVVGLNKQMGLYNRVAWMAAGTPASVFSAEY